MVVSGRRLPDFLRAIILSSVISHFLSLVFSFFFFLPKKRKRTREKEKKSKSFRSFDSARPIHVSCLLLLNPLFGPSFFFLGKVSTSCRLNLKKKNIKRINQSTFPPCLSDLFLYRNPHKHSVPPKNNRFLAAQKPPTVSFALLLPFLFLNEGNLRLYYSSVFRFLGKDFRLLFFIDKENCKKRKKSLNDCWTTLSYLCHYMRVYFFSFLFFKGGLLKRKEKILPVFVCVLFN